VLWCCHGCWGGVYSVFGGGFCGGGVVGGGCYVGFFGGWKGVVVLLGLVGVRCVLLWVVGVGRVFVCVIFGCCAFGIWGF